MTTIDLSGIDCRDLAKVFTLLADIYQRTADRSPASVPDSPSLAPKDPEVSIGPKTSEAVTSEPRVPKGFPEKAGTEIARAAALRKDKLLVAALAGTDKIAEKVFKDITLAVMTDIPYEPGDGLPLTLNEITEPAAEAAEKAPSLDPLANDPLLSGIGGEAPTEPAELKGLDRLIALGDSPPAEFDALVTEVKNAGRQLMNQQPEGPKKLQEIFAGKHLKDLGREEIDVVWHGLKKVGNG